MSSFFNGWFGNNKLKGTAPHLHPHKLSSPFLNQELRFIGFIHYQDPLTKFCIFPHPPYHRIHLVYIQDGEGVCDLKALSPDPQQLNPCLLIQRFPLSSVAALGHSDIL